MINYIYLNTSDSSFENMKVELLYPSNGNVHACGKYICKMILRCFLHTSQHFYSEMYSDWLYKIMFSFI